MPLRIAWPSVELSSDQKTGLKPPLQSVAGAIAAAVESESKAKTRFIVPPGYFDLK